MSPFSGISSLGTALRNRNYRIYATGSSISLVGTWMQRMALGWLTWELTHSGAWLGAMAFAELFPMVIVTPLAGAMIDRTERLRVNQSSQAMMLAQSITLFVVGISGFANIWILLALSLWAGAASGINQPARLALIPALVERSDLNAAVRLNSILFNLARFVGPIIAGLVIVSLGVNAAFLLNALSTAFFLVVLSRLRVSTPKVVSHEKGRLLSHFFEGVRYAMSSRDLASVFIVLIAVAIGARPLMDLMPGIAAELFGSGAEGLSGLTAAIGIGAIVGGLAIGGDQTRASLNRLQNLSTLTLAAALLIFAFTEQLWLGLTVLSVAGFGLARSGIASQTIIQLAVDDNQRGRVLSFYGVVFKGVPAIGALGMGLLSEHLGLRFTIMCGSVIVLLLLAWAHFSYKPAAT